MQCFTVDGSGPDGLRLQERADPGPPGAGEILVDVRAVSLNYRDILMVKGMYGRKQATPIIAASDMAGVIESVGPDVVGFNAGDRVFNAPFRFYPAGTLRPEWARTFVGGSGVDGVLAEKVVYPAVSLVKLPAHLDFAEGATLTIAGLTAWAALVSHARTRPGEWVLLHGTGGVSIFAAQIAKMLGARVILTTSSKEKGDLAKRTLGVDHVLDYRDETWPAKVRDLTQGHGADVIVEVVGGATLSRSIQASAYGARISVIGVLDGLESTINVFHLIMHQVNVQGIYMESTEELHRLANAVEAAKLRPHIDRRFPFAKTPEAYAHLASQKHFGKVVIELDA